MNYREKIRKVIECPQFGNARYGEWGALNLEQRKYIKRLLYELDSADNCVKRLYLKNKKQIEEYQKALDDTMSEKMDLEEENKQLKDNWNKLKEYIRKTKLNEFEKSYGKRYSKTFTQAEVIVCNIIIDHMQELEKVDK